MLSNTENICHLRVQEAITGTKGPAQHFWLSQRVSFTDTFKLSYCAFPPLWCHER